VLTLRNLLPRVDTASLKASGMHTASVVMRVTDAATWPPEQGSLVPPHERLLVAHPLLHPPRLQLPDHTGMQEPRRGAEEEEEVVSSADARRTPLRAERVRGLGGLQSDLEGERGGGGGREGGCNVEGCEGGLLWVAAGPAFVTHRAWTAWVAAARRVPNACLLLSSALIPDARENLEETARAFGLPTARVRVCVRWRPPALSASPAIHRRLAHPEVVLALSEGAKVRRALVSIENTFYIISVSIHQSIHQSIRCVGHPDHAISSNYTCRYM